MNQRRQTSSLIPY
ncbi:BnaC07g12890D [Brassica napus]|uniref:BnaC07g12890D protein n=1 Tax=Brassica napus TaxID=3708 RepID=A0A078GSF1_BRANA|nr:BnaC07g12890D [Brassica napus]